MPDGFHFKDGVQAFCLLRWHHRALLHTLKMRGDAETNASILVISIALVMAASHVDVLACLLSSERSLVSHVNDRLLAGAALRLAQAHSHMTIGFTAICDKHRPLSAQNKRLGLKNSVVPISAHLTPAVSGPAGQRQPRPSALSAARRAEERLSRQIAVAADMGSTAADGTASSVAVLGMGIMGTPMVRHCLCFLALMSSEQGACLGKDWRLCARRRATS